MIEADSGEKFRLTRETHDDALATARSSWQRVHDHRVIALTDLK